MDLVSEYWLFLAKGVTVFALFLATLGGGLVLFARARHGVGDRLRVKSLNRHYESMEYSLQAAMLPKKNFRNLLRKRKRRHQAKTHKDLSSQRRRRIFVLDFHGNVMASGVASLREEVNAILSVATSRDEVLVRLESGGGLVHAYGLAASQLVRIKDKGIPLTVAVDKIAASGGYMMACVADHLIVAPFAVIGSIGVVSQLPNFNRLLKSNDVDFEQFTAGEYKRTVSLFGETTESGRAKLQEEVDNAHALFKAFVRTHRQAVDIESVATGEHWFGTQALELNLVDTLRNSDDYLLSASESADLYQVSYLEKKHLLSRLTRFVGRSSAFDRETFPLPCTGPIW